MAQMNPSIGKKKKKQPKPHGHGEETCGCRGGRGGKRMDGESGVNRCKLLHWECISNRVLLYSTGNSS